MGRLAYALAFLVFCVPIISIWNGIYAFSASLVHGVSISVGHILE